MFEWLSRLFWTPTSSSVAKERLRLVLLSDHLALAPEIIDALRADLIEVISRYVEVDERHCDVTFEHQDAGIAMLANIPILSLRERTPPRAGPPAPPVSEPVAAGISTNGAAPADGVTAAVQVPPKRRKRKAPGAPQPAPAQ